MTLFIALAVLALAAFLAGYRKVALGLIAVALAAGGGLYLYNREDERRAFTRISIPELILENVTLTPYAGSYKIAGRMKNNSAKFKVKQIDFVVAVRDCAGGAAAEKCVTVGESSEVLNLDIPPGEARDFEESVRFSSRNPKLEGRMEWNYSISRIRAE